MKKMSVKVNLEKTMKDLYDGEIPLSIVLFDENQIVFRVQEVVYKKIKLLRITPKDVINYFLKAGRGEYPTEIKRCASGGKSYVYQIMLESLEWFKKVNLEMLNKIALKTIIGFVYDGSGRY